MKLVTTVALRLCKKELHDTKLFVSCGAGLGANRNVELLRPQFTGSTELGKYVEFWTGHLQELAARQASRVLAWWANVGLAGNDGGGRTVFMHLEHIEGETLEIRVPYAEGAAGEIVFGAAIEEPRAQRYLFASGTSK